MKKKVVAKNELKKTAEKPITAPKTKKEKKEIVSVYTSVRQALFAFQGEKISLPRTGTGKSRDGKEYKYVILDVLIDKVIPVLQKYRLGFTQVVVGDKLVTELFHADTDTLITSDIPLGKPENIQDLGGRITYLKRYALTALLGLSAEEDIDASGSTGVMGATVVSPAVPAQNVPEKATVQPLPTNSEVKKESADAQFDGMGAKLSRGEKPAADTSFIKPVTAFTVKLDELTASSEWFAKARNAIESCKTIDAVDFLKPQIETSKKATDEEKKFAAALLKSVYVKLAA